MKLHEPETFEAHRLRDADCLQRCADIAGITVEQLLAGYELEERNTQMAGPGRPRKRTTQAEQLLAAINFVAIAQGEDEYTEYVRLADKYAICFNGQIAAGYPIAEELDCCPHLDKLKAALTRCGKSLALAETPNGSLSVKGDKLRAVVPSFIGARPFIMPDVVAVGIDDRLKEAFKVCGTLVSEAADDFLCASILLEANQCTSTNRCAMLQFWHGINLPPHMVLPKIFTAAVAKAPMALTGFGLTWSEQLGAPSSITLWFENGAWLKTQCYNDRWPDVSHLWAGQFFPVDVPPGLFDAIEAVSKFNDDDTVILVDNAVQSDANPEVGAQYDVPGLQGGKTFDGELVGQVAPFAKKIDLTTFADRAFIIGGEEATPIRGLLMAKGPKSEP